MAREARDHPPQKNGAKRRFLGNGKGAKRRFSGIKLRNFSSSEIWVYLRESEFEFTLPKFQFTPPEFEFTFPKYKFTLPKYQFRNLSLSLPFRT